MTDWTAHTAWGDHIVRWNARRETERAAASKPKRERASSTHKAGPPAALASTPTSETVSSGVGGHPRGG